MTNSSLRFDFSAARVELKGVTAWAETIDTSTAVMTVALEPLNPKVFAMLCTQSVHNYRLLFDMDLSSMSGA